MAVLRDRLLLLCKLISSSNAVYSLGKLTVRWSKYTWNKIIRCRVRKTTLWTESWFWWIQFFFFFFLLCMVLSLPGFAFFTFHSNMFSHSITSKPASSIIILARVFNLYVGLLPPPLPTPPPCGNQCNVFFGSFPPSFVQHGRTISAFSFPEFLTLTK